MTSKPVCYVPRPIGNDWEVLPVFDDGTLAGAFGKRVGRVYRSMDSAVNATTRLNVKLKAAHPAPDLAPVTKGHHVPA